MANQKISELNELLSPLSGDTLPIVNNGETKKISVSNLLSSNTGSYATTGSNTFIGNQNITGSLIVSGSNIEFTRDWPAVGSESHFLRVAPFTSSLGRYYDGLGIGVEHWQDENGTYEHSLQMHSWDNHDNPNYGAELNVGPYRTHMKIYPSGSNGNIANISVQEFLNNGTTAAKIYADIVQIGAVLAESIIIGNTGSLVVISGSNFTIDSPTTVTTSGSFNIAVFSGSYDTYTQINVKNTSNTSGASSDIVCTADNGNEDIHYVNLGINSSGWEFQTSSIGFQNDGYLYNVGQDMYVGVMEPASPDHGHLHLFSEGLWENSSINIVESGSVAFGTGSVTSGFTFEFSGSVKLQNDLQVDGYIQSNGSMFLQPDIIDSRNIEIYNTDTTDIHIKGNATYTFFGDDSNYVKIDSSLEKITINTNSGTTVNGFVVLSEVSGSLDFVDDSAASSGGVPLGGLYRSGSFVMIRMV